MHLRKFTPKLRVIILFIVLFSGISLVPTLQIGVRGQVQQQQTPPTPGTIAPPSITPAPPPPQGLGTGGGATSETAMVIIPQNSIIRMIDNVQIAMDAIGDDEEAMMALESVDQELRNAATAAGMFVENTTEGGGGDIE